MDDSKEMLILKLLSQENYITYNRDLAKEVGIDEAILFGCLCGWAYSLSKNGELKNGEFYCEQPRLMDYTCLSEYRLRTAQNSLVKAGLLEVNKKGIPAKNYFKINYTNLITMLQSTSSLKIKEQEVSKIKELEVQKLDNINTNKLNTNDDTNNLNINICSSTQLDIFNYWNEKQIIVHKELNDKMKKEIDKILKYYSIDEVKIAINHYSEVMHNQYYTLKYPWNLDIFLKQSNAMPQYLDTGSKWLAYQSRKKTREEKQEEANSTLRQAFDNLSKYKDDPEDLPF